MADGHKFTAVRRLNQRLLDRSINAVVLTTPVFGATIVGDSVGFS